VNCVVHPASVQDRDGIGPALAGVRPLFPFIERIFADGGYRGPKARAAVRALGEWELEIVERPPEARGFEVLPERWVVERTFGWLGRCRRLAKDYENLDRFAVAYILLAMIRLMLRRITRLSQCNQT
jgi:transposase